jgi:sugar lactone lactonase YvrE
MPSEPISPSFSLELVHDCRAELSEGPVWHEDALWWVRITDGELCRWDHASGTTERHSFGEPLSAAVPAMDESWLLALKSGIATFDPKTGETRQLVASEEPVNNRFNDGKADPQGRFWIGSMNTVGKAAQGSLYRLDPGPCLTRQLQGVSISNGLAWSGNGQTLYYIDSATRRVESFVFESATGRLGDRRTLHQFADDAGFPDGMAIDESDNLWIALWGGSRVVCLDGLTGEELAEARCPVSQPSSCCFGGPDFDQLFVTTAWQGLSNGQRSLEPMAGSLFCGKPGVRGRPVDRVRVGFQS